MEGGHLEISSQRLQALRSGITHIHYLVSEFGDRTASGNHQGAVRFTELLVQVKSKRWSVEANNSFREMNG